MMSKTNPRDLNQNERELLTYVLTHGSERAQSFLPQLAGIKGVPSCTCGCPSLALFPVDNAPPGAPGEERIICDLVGLTARGESVGLLVFVDDGRLDEMEIYPFGDFELKTPDTNFPTIESLTPFAAASD